MFIIIAGFFFCGVALGVAIGSLHKRTGELVPKAVRERIEARLAAIVRPRRAKVVRLKVA